MSALKCKRSDGVTSFFIPVENKSTAPSKWLGCRASSSYTDYLELVRNASIQYSPIVTWTDSLIPDAYCYWDTTYDAIYTYNYSSSTVYRWKLNRTTGTLTSDGQILTFTPDRVFIGNRVVSAFRTSTGIEIIITKDDSPRANYRWFERAGDAYTFSQVKIQTATADNDFGSSGKMFETDDGQIIFAAPAFSYTYRNTTCFNLGVSVRTSGGSWENVTKKTLSTPVANSPVICKNSITGNYDIISTTVASYGAPITSSYWGIPNKIVKITYDGSSFSSEIDVTPSSVGEVGGNTTFLRVSDGWLIHRNGSNSTSTINTVTNFSYYRAFLSDSGECSSMIIIPKTTLIADYYISNQDSVHMTYGLIIYDFYNKVFLKYNPTKTRSQDKCLSYYDGSNFYGRYQ